ncbi:MAG: hypothetical protein ACK587_15285, partial [Cyanobacteriota bacterium]
SGGSSRVCCRVEVERWSCGQQFYAGCDHAIVGIAIALIERAAYFAAAPSFGQQSANDWPESCNVFHFKINYSQ